jgi:hypothetical protein
VEEGAINILDYFKILSTGTSDANANVDKVLISKRLIRKPEVIDRICTVPSP